MIVRRVKMSGKLERVNLINVAVVGDAETLMSPVVEGGIYKISSGDNIYAGVVEVRKVNEDGVSYRYRGASATDWNDGTFIQGQIMHMFMEDFQSHILLKQSSM